MATIVNTPGNTTSDSGNGMGFLLGIVLLIAFVTVFLLYGLPLIRNAAAPANPQFNVPDKVDINVDTPQQ